MSAPWNYAQKWETCSECGLTAPDVACVDASKLPRCPELKRCLNRLMGRPLSDDRKWAGGIQKIDWDAIDDPPLILLAS